MKHIFVLFIAVIFCLSSYGQAHVTAGQSGTQVRTTINTNFDTLFARTANPTVPLLAEKLDSINNTLRDIFNVKNYGAKGDGATNDATAIINCINAAIAANGLVFFPSGTYVFLDGSTFYNQNKNIRIIGSGKVVLRGNGGDVNFWSTVGSTDTFVYAPKIGEQSLYTNTLYHTVKVNDVLIIESTDYIINQGGGQYYKGELVKVKHVIGNKIIITAPLYDFYNLGTTTIRNMNSGSVKVENIIFDSIPVTTYYNKDVLFSHCDWQKTVTCNLQVYYAYNANVDNCNFTRDTTFVYGGYALSDVSSQNMNMTNNVFSNFVEGIECGGRYPARNILIQNNTYSGWRESTPYAIASHGHCEYQKVLNNTVNSGGISIGGTFADICGNIIRMTTNDLYGGQSVGIRRFFENTTDIVVPPPSIMDNISDNIIFSTDTVVGNVGIYISPSSYKDTIGFINISNNNVKVAGYALLLSGTYNTNLYIKNLNIHNNYFEQLKHSAHVWVDLYAVYFMSGYRIDNIVFTNNTVKSADGGMYCGSDSINLLKVSNNLFNCPTTLVNVDNANAASVAIAENNIFTDRGVLQFYGGFRQAYALNNTFRGAGGIGTSMQAADSLYITGNNYTTFTSSVYIGGGLGKIYRNETGYFHGNLTDGTPTAAEVTAAVGKTPAQMVRGYKAVVRDDNGSGLIYIYVSDGTYWILQGTPVKAN